MELTSEVADLVAVAADSAVVLYEVEGDSDGDRDRVSIPVSGSAKAALFSPSGHRIYVARATEGLLVLDRVSGEELLEIDLPGPAVGLSGDRYGQWVLVRPATEAEAQSTLTRHADGTVSMLVPESLDSEVLVHRDASGQLVISHAGETEVDHVEE